MKKSVKRKWIVNGYLATVFGDPDKTWSDHAEAARFNLYDRKPMNQSNLVRVLVVIQEVGRDKRGKP